MKPYTEFRKDFNNEFERDLSGLFNGQLFSKTIQNNRKQKDIRFAIHERTRNKLPLSSKLNVYNVYLTISKRLNCWEIQMKWKNQYMLIKGF